MLQAGSCTNLSGGLFKGIEQQQAGMYLDSQEAASPGEDGPDAPSAQLRDAEHNNGSNGNGAGVNPLVRMDRVVWLCRACTCHQYTTSCV
jgi:hypothetical protein